MKTVSISEARANLSELVKDIEDGDEQVGITVQGRVRAVLSPAESEPAGGPWVQVASSFEKGSQALPAPFDRHAVDDGGVFPVLWLNTSTGAMVAAIATGRWDTPGARFEIYYAHPDLHDAVPMLDWTSRIPSWSGKNAQEYATARDAVVALLREVLPAV